MSWQPKSGERVIAVLPDGHEIEGLYDRGREGRHVVDLPSDDPCEEFYITVPAVKPVPVEEPKTFGACVKDAKGDQWVRTNFARSYPWCARRGVRASWVEISRRGHVTIVNADPWGES